MQLVLVNTLIVALGLGGLGTAGGVVPNVPAAPASVASAPAVQQPGGSVNPAVRAAENAHAPGELRPMQPVLPQIKLPIKRGQGKEIAASDEPSGAASGGGGAVNDAAARCRAKESRTERAECERRLSLPAPR